MPLVRIDLASTTPPVHVQGVGRAVHEALVATFNAPEADRFQVIGRHAPDELVCSPEFLGVAHSGPVVFVQITCAPGRSTEMKKALYQHIAHAVSAQGYFAAADVIINLVESARENWSFGNGLAPFAQA